MGIVNLRYSVHPQIKMKQYVYFDENDRLVKMPIKSMNELEQINQKRKKRRARPSAKVKDDGKNAKLKRFYR